jgi:hypothetical protein
VPNQLLHHASIVDGLQRHCSLALGVPGAFWIMQSRVGLNVRYGQQKGRGSKAFKKFKSSWFGEPRVSLGTKGYSNSRIQFASNQSKLVPKKLDPGPSSKVGHSFPILIYRFFGKQPFSRYVYGTYWQMMMKPAWCQTIWV